MSVSRVEMPVPKLKIREITVQDVAFADRKLELPPDTAKSEPVIKTMGTEVFTSRPATAQSEVLLPLAEADEDKARQSPKNFHNYDSAEDIESPVSESDESQDEDFDDRESPRLDSAISYNESFNDGFFSRASSSTVLSVYDNYYDYEASRKRQVFITGTADKTKSAGPSSAAGLKSAGLPRLSLGPGHLGRTSRISQKLEVERLLERVSESRQDQGDIYLKICHKLGVVPASYYVRHMNDDTFVMRHRCLGPAGAKALAKPMKKNLSLRKLDLEGNWIEAPGARYMVDMLKENNLITEVNLSCNQLGNAGAEHICNGLLNHNSIRTLNVSGNLFKDSVAHLFAGLIDTNTALRELNISHNEFEEPGGVVLGKAIGANDTLEVLDLSWNHLRLKGGVAVAQAIKVNNGLDVLKLSMNGLSTEGATAVAKSLHHNDTLRLLDISNNRIGIEGCNAMTAALKSNSTLEVLKMGKNPIGKEGAVSVIKAICSSEGNVIEYLDLRDVVVTQEFYDTAEQVQNVREFNYIVGELTKTGGKDPKGHRFVPQQVNPLEVFLMEMESQNLRVVDFFKALDKDQSGSVDRDEFVSGLQAADTQLSEHQIDQLIKMLDKDGDGEIDISEILAINKEFRKVKQKARLKQKAKKQAMANSPAVFALNDGESETTLTPVGD